MKMIGLTKGGTVLLEANQAEFRSLVGMFGGLTAFLEEMARAQENPVVVTRRIRTDRRSAKRRRAE